MKSMIRLAAMAVATLLVAACSQDELVNQPVATTGNGKAAMEFSASLPNMTRANLETVGIDQFGVYCIKTTKTDGESLIMDNFLVKYSDSKPATEGVGTTWGGGNTGDLIDHLSYWYYDGITTADGAKANQALKYWDVNAKRYDFFAYLGYDKALEHVSESGTPTGNVWYNTSEKSLNYKLEAIANEANKVYYQDGYPMIAYQGYSTLTYNDVPFEFKHINGKVNMKFYTDITAYNVRIDEIVLSSTMTNQKCGVKMDENGIVVSYTDIKALSQAFTTPTPTAVDPAPQTYLPVLKADALASATTYFCMPASTVAEDKNKKLTLTVTYTLMATGETIKKTKSVDITTADAVQWKQNTAYTYIFKIGKNEQHPIVFDGITISDYDAVDGGEYTVVDE